MKTPKIVTGPYFKMRDAFGDERGKKIEEFCQYLWDEFHGGEDEFYFHLEFKEMKDDKGNPFMGCNINFNMSFKND